MKELTNENFDESIKSGKTVVDYWAPWCGPCRMFAPIFEETSKELPDIQFAKVNTEESPEIAMKNGIRAIPTMIFYVDGKEIGRFSGAMPKPMFKAKLQEVFG